MTSFVMSIMYNLVGLYFAVSGQLSPLVAAILMPLSSISIMILTFGGSVFTGKRLKLAS
jgi:Cu+-exporting ATPase